MRQLDVTRKTRETDISATLVFPESPGARVQERDLTVKTGIPFFDHMLYAFLFHGGFEGEIVATGDTDVDDHHTVEDVGIVIGSLFSRVPQEFGPVARFGHAIVPMDDSLGEVIVDACGRSYLVYQVAFPQPYAGRFDLALIHEFFYGFSVHARANVHVLGRYGINGHHLAEALFKAAGRALSAAYYPADAVLSTKGTL